MESVAKVTGTVRDGRIVVPNLQFAEGESLELMVWSPKLDDLAPDPARERTPEARETAMRAWLERVQSRVPRLPSLSDYSMSRDCIYRDHLVEERHTA